MWKEAIGGAGLLSIFILIVGIQNKRIEKKMNSDVCKQRCISTDSSFNVIQEQQKVCQSKFKEMTDKLVEQQGTLIEVKTILSIAAKKNGWNK